jgi:recombination protein RecR
MYEGVIQHLIDELGRLPGVGPKGAQRIAFHLLAADPEDVRRLAAALIEMTERVRFCKTCGNVAEADECRICLDTRRDPSVICVVEEPKDVAAVEKIREFRGRYHVLGGAISPIDGIGPDDLRIRELMARLADGTVTELILATDPNLEGEATATFIARLAKPIGIRVTRPASGLPVGGDLEYADEVTLGRAFEGRRLLDVLPVRGVHGRAHRADCHPSGCTAWMPGVMQPVQELLQHRVLDRAVRGHAVLKVRRVSVADFMERKHQPAAAMSSRGRNVILHVRQAEGTLPVHGDGAHRLWILGRQGLRPRRSRRGGGRRDATALPGIRESALGDDPRSSLIIRAEGVSERHRVRYAISHHVQAGLADFLRNLG